MKKYVLIYYLCCVNNFEEQQYVCVLGYIYIVKCRMNYKIIMLVNY